MTSSPNFFVDKSTGDETQKKMLTIKKISISLINIQDKIELKDVVPKRFRQSIRHRAIRESALDIM